MHRSLTTNVAATCVCDAGYGGASCDATSGVALLLSVSPSVVPAYSASRITLTGANLPVGAARVSVTFGASGSEFACVAAVVVSASEVTCQTPSALPPSAAGAGVAAGAGAAGAAPAATTTFVVRIDDAAAMQISVPFSVASSACVAERGAGVCGGHGTCVPLPTADDALVVSLDFDELGGTVAHDGSGHGNHAYLSSMSDDPNEAGGPTWGSGASGASGDYALQLNGKGGLYVPVSVLGGATANEFTLCMDVVLVLQPATLLS